MFLCRTGELAAGNARLDLSSGALTLPLLGGDTATDMTSSLSEGELSQTALAAAVGALLDEGEQGAEQKVLEELSLRSSLATFAVLEACDASRQSGGGWVAVAAPPLNRTVGVPNHTSNPAEKAAAVRRPWGGRAG